MLDPKGHSEKVAANRLSSAEILNDLGIMYSTNNYGVHLIVSHNERVADFWPGTGKWKLRTQKRYSRGVFELLKALDVPPAAIERFRGRRQQP